MSRRTGQGWAGAHVEPALSGLSGRSLGTEGTPHLLSGAQVAPGFETHRNEAVLLVAHISASRLWIKDVRELTTKSLPLWDYSFTSFPLVFVRGICLVLKTATFYQYRLVRRDWKTHWVRYSDLEKIDCWWKGLENVLGEERNSRYWLDLNRLESSKGGTSCHPLSEPAV